MKCINCKSDLFATNFIAVVDSMTGTFKATQIDENIKEIKLLAIGRMDEIKNVIEREAMKGNLIRLEQIYL